MRNIVFFKTLWWKCLVQVALFKAVAAFEKFGMVLTVGEKGVVYASSIIGQLITTKFSCFTLMQKMNVMI